MVAPVVEVVRLEDRSRELRQREVVLVHQPAAGQHADACAVHPSRDRRQHLAERGRLQAVVPDQRRGDPLGRVGEPERVPALVADPRVVHLVLVARQMAHDLPTPDVDPDVAAGRAVRADRVAVRQIERPGGEPVRYGRQRPDRADLHRVAAERRTEVLPGRDRDPFARSPRIELEEAVARDLVAEPGTTRAQHTPLPIEGDERRQRDRLLEDALGFPEPAVPRSVRERLVLERALAAAIADRTVERVVQQQELEVRALSVRDLLIARLRHHRHAGGDRHRARRGELRLALDPDVALTARPGGLEQRVVAEPRDLDAELLGGADDQRPRRNRHLLAVDRQGHVGVGTQTATSSCSTRNGHRPSRTCSSNSSAKCFRLESITAAAPSASAQKARNMMCFPMSRITGRSSSWP